MGSFQISTIDLIMLLVYFGGISAVGIIASRRIRSTANYFLGERQFNKWIMIGQTFGTGTHAEMPLSLAGAVYSVGISGIWFQWRNLFATPFYWLAATVNFSIYWARNGRLDSWVPDVFVIALAAGIGATIVVSLATPPEPKSARDSFFVRVNTPSIGDNDELPAEQDRAVVARDGRQLLITNLLHLRRGTAGLGIRAYRVDLWGFAIGWTIVIALVGCVWLLFSVAG